MNKSRITRIQQMESKFQTCREITDALRSALDALENHREDFKELFQYSGSKTWMEDFEADERGEFPKDMKRGVLSEDGLYDLWVDYCNSVKNMSLWEKMNGDIADDNAIPYMEEFDEFNLFDPMTDDISSLPDFSGDDRWYKTSTDDKGQCTLSWHGISSSKVSTIVVPSPDKSFQYWHIGELDIQSGSTVVLDLDYLYKRPENALYR